jgi:hypothetical protein
MQHRFEILRLNHSIIYVLFSEQYLQKRILDRQNLDFTCLLMLRIICLSVKTLVHY